MHELKAPRPTVARVGGRVSCASGVHLKAQVPMFYSERVTYKSGDEESYPFFFAKYSLSAFSSPGGCGAASIASTAASLLKTLEDY